mmetsp:Transcript_2356/g.7519  ORF Transcript_2356/g.7519 Transcript_2356/m.7519 type:complete len:575 (+) Transcript_2356:257-1981(+)
MVHKKGKSKRQTLHQKYKIERKVREHNRKQRREARKNPKRTTLKKDPGIPNLHPFKEALLEKLTQQKLRAEEHAAEVRRRRKKLLEQKRKSGELGDEEEDVEMALDADVDTQQQQQKKKSVSELAREATERREEYEEVEASGVQAADGSRLVKETSRHAYFREFKKVVEASDVILEVLDARDPIGCRCTDVEDYIMRRDPNKRIVLVVNKIDLVPKDVAMQWLKYLRTQFPAIAFKCSTQKQRTNLRRAKVKASAASQRSLQKGSDCVGASHLIELLKNYSRNAKMKQALTVGIVGYPNVGKSSTINVLYGTKKTTVSSTPGKTKHFQTLRVSLEESPHEADDLELWLCDCPGLVFPSLVSTKAHMVVNGLLPIDTLRDYRGPISLLCTRIPRWMWLDSYGLRLPMPPDHLPENEPPSVDELLQAYGMLRGFMNSHGTADAGRTARTLLKDYVDGIKLLYCAPPPPIVDEESLALTPEQCAQRAKDYNLLGTRQEANASKVEKRSAVQMQRTRKVAGLDDFLNQQNIRAHQTRLHGMTRGRTALSRAGGRGGGQLPSKKANRRGGGRVKRWDQV